MLRAVKGIVVLCGPNVARSGALNMSYLPHHTASEGRISQLAEGVCFLTVSRILSMLTEYGARKTCRAEDLRTRTAAPGGSHMCCS